MARKKKTKVEAEAEVIAIVRTEITNCQRRIFTDLREQVRPTFNALPWSVVTREATMDGYCITLYTDHSYGPGSHDLASMSINLTTSLPGSVPATIHSIANSPDTTKGRLSDERAYEIGSLIRKHSKVSSSVSVVGTERDASQALAYAKRVEQIAYIGTTMEMMITKALVPTLIGVPFMRALRKEVEG